MSEDTNGVTVRPRSFHRAGIMITLIAIVGAVAIMDIVAGMIVDLVRIKAEEGL